MLHWTLLNNSCSACAVVPQECTMKVQEGKFKLQDLLVVPMQRVLKYHLLLKVGHSRSTYSSHSNGDICRRHNDIVAALRWIISEHRTRVLEGNR